jgi:hypothetical protein
MVGVHKQILQLIYYSNGGFGWGDLWDEIPVQYRRFYVKQLEEIKKKEAQAASSGSSGDRQKAKKEAKNQTKEAQDLQKLMSELKKRQ